jgi:hypothetical protein
VPLTAIGALIALLIAPGFLLIRGYERRRYRHQPDRDIYAVAEAIVASAIWLGLSWVVLLRIFGDPLSDVGLFPVDEKRLEDHPLGVVSLGLAVILLPYGVGVGGAAVGNALSRTTRRPFSWLRWTLWKLGFFKIPNAWDRAWAQLERHGAGHVVIKMKDGSFVVGGYGKQSRIDVSPLPTRTIFLPKGHAHAGPAFAGGPGMLLNLEQNREQLLADPAFQPVTDEVGVVVDGDEIAAVFFRKA